MVAPAPKTTENRLIGCSISRNAAGWAVRCTANVGGETPAVGTAGVSNSEQRLTSASKFLSNLFTHLTMLTITLFSHGHRWCVGVIRILLLRRALGISILRLLRLAIRHLRLCFLLYKNIVSRKDTLLVSPLVQAHPPVLIHIL